MATYFDYAIIGGGCIGASTSLALQREYPDARIVWLEGTAEHTASKDINKIIRTPYPDEDYVALAKKAMEKWEADHLYRGYYHRTGWIQVISEGSYRSTRKGANDRKITTEEMLSMVGSQNEPNFSTGEELWLNEEIGSVDANLALEAVAKEAAKLGVERKKVDAAKLIMREDVCEGIEFMDGHIMAKTTVVAAGPWTPGILDRSGVTFPKHFFTTVGVVLGTLPLRNEEYERLKSMPILVSDKGEIMMSKLRRALKISTTSTFAIERMDDLKHDSPLDIEPNRIVLEKMLSEFAGRPLESWICPDLMTPLQHQIVDKIPNTSQLYVATGGSFHSFKLLPVFGDMVVRRLQGRIDSNTVEGRLLKRWVWERAEETVAIHQSVVPKELRQD